MKRHDELTHWLRVATDVFAHMFPQDLWDNVKQWPLCNLLLPHAQRVIDTSRPIPELRVTPLAVMLTYVAVCLEIQYRDEDAAALHKEAIYFAIAVWGPNDPKTLFLQCNLSHNLLNQKRLSEAETIYRRVWQYLESSAPHTPEWEDLRFHVPHYIAHILTIKGREEEAEEMQGIAYNAVLASRGEGHTDTLRIMNNRALALSGSGKYDEAELMGRTVVERQLKTLGPANQMTLYSMKNLARYLREQGKFSEAREVLDRVDKVEKRLFPVGHPDRLATAKLSARQFYLQKDYALTERELRQAQIDGEAFPQTSYVLLNLQAELAMYLDVQGKHHEAEAIARKSLASREELSSEPDEDTCRSMQHLATILCHLHREKEAEDLQWQILQHYGDDGRPNNKGLSRHARMALSAIMSIHSIIHELKQVEWAENILQRQDEQRIGGSKAFQTRVLLLSIVMSKLGCHTQGMELRARWRDKNDSSSLWLVNNLAEEYLHQKRNTEARDILRPLVADAQKLLGPKDELTLFSMGLLAVATGSSTAEGLSLLRSVIENAEPDNKMALVAWNNLGIGYERRNMCLEALEAFQAAFHLASEHFDDANSLVVQFRTNYQQFLNEHISKGPEPGMLILRYRRPVDSARVEDAGDGVGNDGHGQDAADEVGNGNDSQNPEGDVGDDECNQDAADKVGNGIDGQNPKGDVGNNEDDQDTADEVGNGNHGQNTKEE